MTTTFRAAVMYAFGAVGGLLFGYDAGIISGALLFIDREFALTPLTTGLLVSALLVGCSIGAMAAGRLSDRLGRRRLLIAAGALFAVGSAGAALAGNAATLTGFRLLLGLAAGTASVVVPTYLSELAPARHRGKLSILFTVSLATGLLAAVLVAYALSAGGSWRWMLAIGAIPALVVAVGLWFQPESPRWLVAAGRTDEARRVLGRYRDPARADAELDSIAETARHSTGSTGWRELLTRRLLPVLVMTAAVSAFSQLMGNGAVVFYGPTILTGAGFSDSGAILGAVVLNATNLFAVVIGVALVDRVGRRPLLLVGGGGMAVSLAGLGAVVLSGGGADGSILVLLLAVYMMCFGASWGGLPFVIAAEVFPLRVRGAGVGVASVANWLASLAFSLVFPVLVAVVDIGAVFLVIAAVCVVATVFVVWRVPETRGRSLEQIETALYAVESTELKG